MTFSSLISRTVPHHGKYSSRYGQTPQYAVPHHWASTTDNSGIEALTNPNRDASVHYFITTYGEIIGQVPEEYRAWTTGSQAADAPAITIEIQNSGGKTNNDDYHPNSWRISPKAFEATVKLIADIARRYKWGSVPITRVRGHREFAATACPGGYVWNQRSNIALQANNAIDGKPGGTDPVKPNKPSTSGKTVWQLADEVMAGIHGDGEARKQSLGSMYDAVQTEVNRRYGVGSAAATKTIAQLADEVMAGIHGDGEERKQRLGANYNPVQAEVNRRYGQGGRAPSGVNISQLADAVIRGEYGNGEERKQRLGGNYNAVQAEVDRRYNL